MIRCETLPLNGCTGSRANSPRWTAPSGYHGLLQPVGLLAEFNAVRRHALEAAVEDLFGKHRGRQPAQVLDELAVLEGTDRAAADRLVGHGQGGHLGGRAPLLAEDRRRSLRSRSSRPGRRPRRPAAAVVSLRNGMELSFRFPQFVSAVPS